MNNGRLLTRLERQLNSSKRDEFTDSCICYVHQGGTDNAKNNEERERNFLQIMGNKCDDALTNWLPLRSHGVCRETDYDNEIKSTSERRSVDRVAKRAA